MADIYADVIRLEGTLAGVTGILRSGAIAVTTDTPKRIVMKRAAGGYNHWTADEDWDPGATGISYTNSSYQSITTVQEALDISLTRDSAYFADTGVTGVPYWGDGFIDDVVTQVGSAVYSTDGHVYFMGEEGFTGVSTLAGCKFVVNPVPIGDDIKFVDAVSNAAHYSYMGYTGAAANDAELYMYANSTDVANTCHLRLEAEYGKVKLTTGTGADANNGVLLSGYDGTGDQYNAAAASTFRDLYADEDGNIVVGESDNAQRYKTGGFTAIISDDFLDAPAYGYWTYQIIGDYCSLTSTWTYGYSTGNSLGVYGLPDECIPAVTMNLHAIVRDEYQCGSDAVRPARMALVTGATGVNFYPAYTVATPEADVLSYKSDFGATGYKGVEVQCWTYKVN